MVADVGHQGDASSGRGPEKVRKADMDSALAELYCYEDPNDPETFANVFRMFNRRVISIMLVAESRNGMYAGDKIGVWELTNRENIQGWRYEIDTPISNALTVEVFSVSVQSTAEDVIVTVQDPEGNLARVSVNALYRWRVYGTTNTATIGDESVKFRAQGGGPVSGLFYFPSSVSTLVLDPECPRQRLCPKYVINTNTLDGKRVSTALPFGQTGYVLRWSEEQKYFFIDLATGRR
jgi:hypothetical protein